MNPAKIAQQARLSLFTPAMAAEAAWQQKLCALWPHDPGVSGVVRSTVPVVFVNGTADPADPPANVAAAPRTMPNALLVTVPGGSHEVARHRLHLSPVHRVHPGRQARQPGQLGSMRPHPGPRIPRIPARTITPRTAQLRGHHRPGRGEVASDQVAGQAVRPATRFGTAHKAGHTSDHLATGQQRRPAARAPGRPHGEMAQKCWQTSARNRTRSCHFNRATQVSALPMARIPRHGTLKRGG